MTFCRHHVSYLLVAAGCAVVVLALLSVSSVVYYARVGGLSVLRAVIVAADEMLFGGFRYWWTAHQQARLGGPFHYYLPVLATYEPLVFAGAPLAMVFYAERRLGLLAAVIGVSAAAWMPGGWTAAFASAWVLAGAWTVVSLWDARREFLACWVFVGVLQLMLYSYANEKVPWLAVHILLPWLVVTGAFVADLYRTATRVSARACLVIVVVAIEIFSARTSWIVNTRNGSNVAEPLVQLDYGARVPDAVARIQALAASRPLRIAIEPTRQWPFAWYFRDLNVRYLDAPADPSVEADVIIAEDRPLPAAMANQFTVSRLQYHHWTDWMARVHLADISGWLRFLRHRDQWGFEDGAMFMVWTRTDIPNP